MGVTTRLTYNTAHDFWGADGIVWPYFFNERTPQSLYLVGDTVHILWVRSGAGDRYNRSRDRGNTWDYCTGIDCGGIMVLNYGWESSIVARGSKVHAVAYCHVCSPSSWVPYNRSMDNGMVRLGIILQLGKTYSPQANTALVPEALILLLWMQL